MTASSLGNRSTLLSLIALIGGLGLGILIHGSGNAFLTGLAGFIEPLGRVWVRALQMVVVPLIISQLLLVMLRRQGATVGRLGPAAIGLFVVLLLLGAAVTLVTVPPVLDRLPVDHALVTSLNPMIPESARAAAERDVIPVGFADWLVGLIPTNPARSLVDGDLLQIMLFTLFFGWAASRTPRGPGAEPAPSAGPLPRSCWSWCTRCSASLPWGSLVSPSLSAAAGAAASLRSWSSSWSWFPHLSFF